MNEKLGVKPEIEVLSARAFIRFKEQIVSVYRAAFSPPPYEKRESSMRQFAVILPQHTERNGFRSVVARVGESGEIVGFAYGYTSQRGQWWYDHVARTLGREQGARWLGNAFEVVELAVDPRSQRQGIGGALHDALLYNLPYDTAVLSTLDAETAGLHLYRKRGWKTLISQFYFPNVTRAYLIMGRDL